MVEMIHFVKILSQSNPKRRKCTFFVINAVKDFHVAPSISIDIQQNWQLNNVMIRTSLVGTIVDITTLFWHVGSLLETQNLPQCLFLKGIFALFFSQQNWLGPNGVNYLPIEFQKSVCKSWLFSPRRFCWLCKMGSVGTKDKWMRQTNIEIKIIREKEILERLCSARFFIN